MQRDERDDRDAGRWESVEEASELLNEERFREAMELLRDAIAKDAQNPYAYFLLGQAFYEIGEMERARDAYEAALKLAPRHLGARVALCHVLRKLGDHRGAIREGMAAQAQAPEDADALYATGMAYFARGDTTSARRYLEAFLCAKPELEVKLEVEAILAAMQPAS